MTIKTKRVNMADALNDPTFSYLDSFADAQDLEIISHETTLILLRLRQLNKKLTEQEKIKATASLKYKRAFRKSYSEQSEGNESRRKLIAEIKCEKEEQELIVAETQVKVLQQEISLARVELDALKTLGFNIRQEMKTI